MKTLIAAALITLSLAGVAKADTGTLTGKSLPGWAERALSYSA